MQALRCFMRVAIAIASAINSLARSEITPSFATVVTSPWKARIDSGVALKRSASNVSPAGVRARPRAGQPPECGTDADGVCGRATSGKGWHGGHSRHCNCILLDHLSFQKLNAPLAIDCQLKCSDLVWSYRYCSFREMFQRLCVLSANAERQRNAVQPKPADQRRVAVTRRTSTA